MPTKTAVATTTQVVMADDPELLAPGLQFNEPLSWRAGKAIPIADLLRRLQILFKEMRGMEQEEDERDSFKKVAKELASPNLLAHKDKGVKAWTACCLVEVLRLCAPDAPYTGQQLKDIFTMLVTIVLPALSDPSNAYNNQHLHVLDSLAQVKSIVLLTDLPSSETLVTYLFTSFFDILSGSSKASTGEELGKNVEFNMTLILGFIVDESGSLPSEVIDIIMAQFLRTDPRVLNGGAGKAKKNDAKSALEDRQSTLILNDLPPAYNMAKTICNSCPEKMARHISQYFNDVIVNASTSSNAKHVGKNRSNRRNDDIDDSDNDDPNEPTEDDLNELRKAHQLPRELWRACPAVLQNVIPQLEAELNAENVQLRLLATETLGDMISGIGAAGPPPAHTMDPCAYPAISLLEPAEPEAPQNLLTKPSSPLQFAQTHPQAYEKFLSRKQDKSSVIRSALATGIGRILITAAGGVGLSQHEEDCLIDDLARLLSDSDEKVRMAAVKVVGSFTFKDVIIKFGSRGNVTTNGSVLGTLAERVRDRKHAVRAEAMRVLGRIWGVAAGAIAAGEEKVIAAVGAAPAKILDTFYANDMEINALIDRTIFEQLLPLAFPPIKAKSTKNVNGNSQRAKDTQSNSQVNGESEVEESNPDRIRTERILVLAKNLDEKSKRVFFANQGRQVVLARVMTAYLQRCEDYNGGIMDENEANITGHLSRIIDQFCKQLPDPSKAAADLWKFAKMHDRRSYALIRFCMAPESDYRTVFKAMKEFTKRIETSIAAPTGLLDTLTVLLYRVSLIVYNKSHVPTIMEYSKSDDKALSGIAHVIMRDISSQTPEVLKAHIQEICRTLEEEAPSPKKANSPGASENLKACASFASKFAKEIPHDRKFIQAMTSFAMFGSPPEAAKYAVSIIMATSDKKELLAKDLAKRCVKGFEYGGHGFLSRLATLSQLMLLAPNEVDEESDAVIEIALKQILLQVRTDSTNDADSYGWSDTVETECEAKCWALKILANRVRSHPTTDTLSDVAAPVYKLLSTLITQVGETSVSNNTPGTHRPRLRLLAARLFLKLCTEKHHDALLTPTNFNSLAVVAQDSEVSVRSAFLQRLTKYLGQQKLPQRFYTIPFLLAFEPNDDLKSHVTTWIRSRVVFFSSFKSQSASSVNSNKQSTIMESVFARFLSLLVHHPDYESTSEDLIDFGRYIIFYLQNVATEENISLIYHIAQRVKQSRDAVIPRDNPTDPSKFDLNLYNLSDLAQLTIRKFEEAHSWVVQTYPAKIRLPTSLFAVLSSHDEAQQIAEHNYLPEGVEEGIEGLVRTSMRATRSSKKRKSEGEINEGTRENKKPKGLPIRKANTKEKRAPKTSTASKTPKKKAPIKENVKINRDEESNERRRSGRVRLAGDKSYAEREDEEDDNEMEVLEWEYVDGGHSDAKEEDRKGNEPDDRESEQPNDQESDPAEHEEPSPSPSPSPSREPQSKSKSKRKPKQKTTKPTPPPPPPPKPAPRTKAKDSAAKKIIPAPAPAPSASIKNQTPQKRIHDTDNDDDDDEMSDPPDEASDEEF